MPTTEFVLTQVEGPICQGLAEYGDCSHITCWQADLRDESVLEGQAFCATHGWQQITKSESTPGFCAGSVYWTELACGDSLIEDLSYLET